MGSVLKVSVVMPVYNEEKYIDNCVQSLLEQDFQKEDMEWIFVDGGSVDSTVEILNAYSEKYPGLIKVLSNPHKIVPYAMNIGIKESKGEYIIRLDAHADYAKDYITKCVYFCPVCFKHTGHFFSFVICANNLIENIVLGKFFNLLL